MSFRLDENGTVLTATWNTETANLKRAKEDLEHYLVSK